MEQKLKQEQLAKAGGGDGGFFGGFHGGGGGGEEEEQDKMEEADEVQLKSFTLFVLSIFLILATCTHFTNLWRACSVLYIILGLCPL